MDFNLIVAFCFIVLMIMHVQPTSEKVIDIDFDGGDDDGEKERWLSDEENYETLDYFADAIPPSKQQEEKCPSVPEVISSSACMATPCLSDRDCGNEEGHCCDNGCVFTCFGFKAGPTYIDWVRQPKKQRHNVEPCSTTRHMGEDPLLCPTDYICHIEQGGNAKKDIPNLGHCVPEKDVLIPDTNKSNSKLENDCFLAEYVLVDGASIKLRHKTWYGIDINSFSHGA